MSLTRGADSLRPDYQVPCILGLALTACAAAAPIAARAQEAPLAYVAVAVGASDLEKPHQTIANAPAPGSTLSVVNDVDLGWSGRLALGRRFGPVRLEAEIGRSENKSKSYSAISPISVTLPQHGKTDATRFMANAYYDFPMGLYVGAGAGSARVTVTTFAAPAKAPSAPPSQLLDYRDSQFAYQLMAGASHPLTGRLTADLQYRWFDAGTAKGRDSRGERATRQMHGHNLDLGLRYAF